MRDDAAPATASAAAAIPATIADGIAAAAAIFGKASTAAAAAATLPAAAAAAFTRAAALRSQPALHASEDKPVRDRRLVQGGRTLAAQIQRICGGHMRALLHWHARVRLCVHLPAGRSHGQMGVHARVAAVLPVRVRRAAVLRLRVSRADAVRIALGPVSSELRQSNDKKNLLLNYRRPHSPPYGRMAVAVRLRHLDPSTWKVRGNPSNILPGSRSKRADRY